MVHQILIGHHTDAVAKTGCTVIVFPPDTVASGEVRGGAPASSDFALLDPLRSVDHVDAVIMTGGSAFGLIARGGVMAGLEADGRGYQTSAGPVPIVVGMGIYDLAVGDGTVRPNAEDGRRAYDDASSAFDTGLVGAGTGATVGNWRGREAATPGGFGTATLRSGDLTVTAFMTVNALGDRNDGTTTAAIVDGSLQWPDYDSSPFLDPPISNTTIGVVSTNASLTKLQCFRAAQRAHDGLARALVPAHTGLDGDAIVVAATGMVDASEAKVQMLAAAAVETAIRNVA